MNNGDLIRREALAKEFNKMTLKCLGAYSIDDYANAVAGLIDFFPAVDAVEVVRCKDCKYQDDNTSCPMLNAVAYTKDDDFCCAGRRGRKIKEMCCGGCGKEEKTQEEARKETQNIFLGVRFPKDGE